jgi:hypothetical protein
MKTSFLPLILAAVVSYGVKHDDGNTTSILGITAFEETTLASYCDDCKKDKDCVNDLVCAYEWDDTRCDDHDDDWC